MACVFKKRDLYWIDYRVDGRRKRECIGPNKKLAEDVLAKRRVEIREGRYFEKQKTEHVLFLDFAREYLEYCKPRKRSWQRDQTSLVSLNRAFTGKFLDEIIVRDVERYQTARAKVVARSTVDREFDTLSALFSAGVRWGKVSSNPVRGVRRFRPKNQRVRFLTNEEADRLLDCCAKHVRPIVLTALNTGMRKQEILKLKWSAVDFDQGVIRVGAEMAPDGSPSTKGKKTRTIPMNETLTETLLGLRIRKVRAYVFTGGKGRPFGDVKKGFKAAVGRAEIKDFCFHDLRHTFASHLVMKGESLKVVQELLGHSTIEMTMRYAHLSPETKQEAVEKLSFGGDKAKRSGHQSGHQAKVVRGRFAVSA